MKSFLRVSGALGCAIASLLLTLTIANRYAAAHGGHDVQNMLGPGLGLLVLGICFLIASRFVSRKLDG
jgi:ABC-type phosphate transport system permease subunit